MERCISQTVIGTLCVSSQVGCSLDCSSVRRVSRGLTRILPWRRSLQVFLAAQSFGLPVKTLRKIVTNVVMMGMGEPLLNFDSVVDAMSLMLEDQAYGLSKRRVTLSTSGVVPVEDLLESPMLL